MTPKPTKPCAAAPASSFEPPTSRSRVESRANSRESRAKQPWCLDFFVCDQLPFLLSTLDSQLSTTLDSQLSTTLDSQLSTTLDSQLSTSYSRLWTLNARLYRGCHETDRIALHLSLRLHGAGSAGDSPGQ